MGPGVDVLRMVYMCGEDRLTLRIVLKETAEVQRALINIIDLWTSFQLFAFLPKDGSGWVTRERSQ